VTLAPSCTIHLQNIQNLLQVYNCFHILLFLVHIILQVAECIIRIAVQGFFSFHLESATITNPLRDLVISVGSPIALTCNVSGLPPPQISWIIPTSLSWQTTLTTSSSLVTVNQSQANEGLFTSNLLIPNVNVTGGGVYSCLAENSLGNDTEEAVVTVYG